MELLKIPFLRLGQWKHPVYGDVNITQDTFDQIIRNFQNNVLGRPPFIRLGHDKDGKSTFGDAPAEGWVKEVKQEGNILFGMVEPTTGEAADNIRTKRYRFASAEYNPNGVNKETGEYVGALLSAIALTNEPFLTRLPEATLLADVPGMFYLDFSEAKEEDKHMPWKKIEETINKLSETMTGFIASFKPAAPAPGVDEATKQKLADMEAAQKATNEALAKLNTQLAESEKGRRLAEVDKDAAALVAQGIPPVMVEQWKTIALSAPGQAMVKLADHSGKELEMTAADAFKQTLLALPEEHRIPMGQRGTQSVGDDPDKIKLACDDDIRMLGGEVTADGKYKI